ncbi:MAG: chemotaxis protein CheW [Spirochaetales bacterium]|nr:chemotaxis protein CheW [Spirochaetales bacterium]
MDNMTMNQQRETDEKSSVANVDFRMVTFTLAGRDYAIDIMKVKEISKDNKFTYVPNAAPFVVGVYNLRGDIISVIDLRIFFNQLNMGLDKSSSNQENMIILRLEDHTIAVIVDTIDKVVGIPSESIQPPHPLFGDINVKYISGIVESDKKLYVILDVEKIFNSDDTEVPEQSSIPVQIEDFAVVTQPGPMQAEAESNDDQLNVQFIAESLATFQKMYVSAVNREWVEERYKTWIQARKTAGKDVQFADEQDALSFVEGFNSPYSGSLWNEDYIQILEKILPDPMNRTFYALDAGCGSGYETYSLASIIKKKSPQTLLKILAYDNDLMAISTAPSLMLEKFQVPEYYHDLLTESVSGRWQFEEAIKNSIIFEYHDIMHHTNLPALDMVVIRDLLSLLRPEAQLHVLNLIVDNLKPGGIIIVGKNEELDENLGFTEKVIDGFIYYQKK